MAATMATVIGCALGSASTHGEQQKQSSTCAGLDGWDGWDPSSPELATVAFRAPSQPKSLRIERAEGIVAQIEPGLEQTRTAKR